MAERVLIGCFEVPGWGGASTSAYQLFRRMREDGGDLEVEFVNIIAEDDEAVSLLIAKTLESDGHEVVTVFSGLDAIDRVTSEAFDLVILDQFLPDRFGMEVLAAVREAGSDVTVIVVSGLDDEDEIVRFFELGASDFIRKPFSRTELLARIAIRLEDPSP